MPAIKSQGARLQVSTAEAAADIISGITQANPAVVTATAHGMANGTIITITGVNGMVEVNDRAFVIANVATDSFELTGIDSTVYTAYGSGGSAVAHTMTDVGEVSDVSGFDGEAPEVDTSHLRSRAAEYLLGLQDFGNVQIEVNRQISDAGQVKMRRLKESQATGTFAIILSNGATAAFRALVKSFPFRNQKNDAFRGSSTLRVTGEPAEFA